MHRQLNGVPNLSLVGTTAWFYPECKLDMHYPFGSFFGQIILRIKFKLNKFDIYYKYEQ